MTFLGRVSHGLFQFSLVAWATMWIQNAVVTSSFEIRDPGLLLLNYLLFALIFVWLLVSAWEQERKR